MTDLRKRIEAKGCKQAISYSIENDLASVAFEDGFLAALDLLWPVVEACDKIFRDSKKSYGEMDIDTLGNTAYEALRKIGGAE